MTYPLIVFNCQSCGKQMNYVAFSDDKSIKESYPHNDVPMLLGINLIGTMITCSHCQEQWSISIKKPVVHLELELLPSE